MDLYNVIVYSVNVKMNLLHRLQVVTSLYPQEFADDPDNLLVLDVLKADRYLNAAALCADYWRGRARRSTFSSRITSHNSTNSWLATSTNKH